jgi:two-component system chemotaxis response regulator CheY
MKRILVVDDQLAIRNMFKKIFAESEFSIDLAEDGAIAYTAAKKYTYDMVISDYHMPNVNGVELIIKLRKLTAYANKPLIIVSTMSNERCKADAKKAGATGWFSKPIKPQHLLPVVTRLLK